MANMTFRRYQRADFNGSLSFASDEAPGLDRICDRAGIPFDSTIRRFVLIQPFRDHPEGSLVLDVPNLGIFVENTPETGLILREKAPTPIGVISGGFSINLETGRSTGYVATYKKGDEEPFIEYTVNADPEPGGLYVVKDSNDMLEVTTRESYTALTEMLDRLHQVAQSAVDETGVSPL